MNEKRIERNNLRNKLFRESNIKECFCNSLSNCKGEIVVAHTIQENGILNLIEESVNKNNLLYSFEEFNRAKEDIFEELELVGKSKATTFTGFCDFHDSTIFRPIENGVEFDIQNEEQCFLHAFRSFARHYYRFHKSIKFRENPNFLKLLSVDDKLSNFNKICDLKKYVICLESFRDILLNSLRLQDYSSFYFLRLQFDKSIKISTANVQRIYPTNNSGFVLNAFPQENQTNIIAMCLRNDLIATDHLRRIRSIGNINRIANIMSFYLINSSTILSPSTWSKISDIDKHFIIQLMTNEDVNIEFQKKIFDVDFKMINLLKKAG